MQGAVLSAKLPHLERWTEHRIRVADRYLQRLAGIPDVVLPVRREWARQVYHLFVVRTSRRDALKTHLNEHRIETGVHVPRLADLPPARVVLFDTSPAQLADVCGPVLPEGRRGARAVRDHRAQGGGRLAGERAQDLRLPLGRSPLLRHPLHGGQGGRETRRA